MNLAAQGRRHETGHWAAPCIVERRHKRAAVEISWIADGLRSEGDRKGLFEAFWRDGADEDLTGSETAVRRKAEQEARLKGE